MFLSLFHHLATCCQHGSSLGLPTGALSPACSAYKSRSLSNSNSLSRAASQLFSVVIHVRWNRLTNRAKPRCCQRQFGSCRVHMQQTEGERERQIKSAFVRACVWSRDLKSMSVHVVLVAASLTNQFATLIHSVPIPECKHTCVYVQVNKILEFHVNLLWMHLLPAFQNESQFNVNILRVVGFDCGREGV